MIVLLINLCKFKIRDQHQLGCVLHSNSLKAIKPFHTESALSKEHILFRLPSSSASSSFSGSMSSACVIQSKYPFRSSSSCCFSRSFWKSPRALAFSLSLENSLSNSDKAKKKKNTNCQLARHFDLGLDIAELHTDIDNELHQPHRRLESFLKTRQWCKEVMANPHCTTPELSEILWFKWKLNKILNSSKTVYMPPFVYVLL